MTPRGRFGLVIHVNSRHVVFVSYPGFGHIKPTLAVASELIRRGHRVTYVVTDHYADRIVAATGARVLAYHSLIPDAGRTEAQLDDTSMVLGLIKENWAPAAKALTGLADDPPDVVVHDVLVAATAKLLCRQFGAALVAGYLIGAMNEAMMAELAVPDVDYAGPRFLQLYEDILAEVRPWGVANLMDVVLGGPLPSRNLVFLPRTFQLEADTFDDTYRFVGPCLSDTEREQSWRPADPARQLVLASLGTSPSSHREAFLRTCVRAADGQPWQLVVILGNLTDPEELGALPDNVTVLPWLPHTAALPYAAGFVTHGGMGSIMEALSFGVPMLVAPDTKEQRSNAERAVELGLARELPRPRREMTPELLGHLVTGLLADRDLRRRAHAMRTEIDRCGGAVEAADELLALAASRPFLPTGRAEKSGAA